MRTPQFGRVPFALVTSGALARLTAADARVLLAICGHAAGNGCAFPGKARLAALCGLHARTVERAVGRLERLGVLGVEVGGGRTHASRYRLIGGQETPAGTPPFTEETPAAASINPGGRVPKPRRARPTHNRVEQTEEQNPPTPQGGKDSESPDPLSEHPTLNTSDFLRAWGEWVAYRGELKKPLKASTIRKQLSFLAGYGPRAAVEIIGQSIRNGWQGLFPLRGGDANQRGRGGPSGGGDDLLAKRGGEQLAALEAQT